MFIVIHYSEIGTKGKNRKDFENKLITNIQNKLKGLSFKVKRIYGRIILDTDLDKELIIKKLSKIFGISSFSFAEKSELDINDIKEKVLIVAKDKTGEIRVETKRSNKSFELKSIEINQKVVEYLFENGFKVNIRNHDHLINIEICEKNAFIYDNVYLGLGGLPVGITGKVVCLLSGGIDSPVAGFKLMKRGCNVIFVHFSNNKQEKNKILKLIEILSQYQINTKIYVVDFTELQKEIIANVDSRYRMLLYRKFMFKIAELVAENEQALALVTGDNLAQVASQTLENLDVLHSGLKYNVFSPLIGEDKIDIIKIAQSIGTFETSIIPYQDCCSFLIDQHPITHAKFDDIHRFEERIDPKLVLKGFKNAEIRLVKNGM